MSNAIEQMKSDRKAIELVGSPKRVREILDSGPLLETFKAANPTGYQRIVQSFLMACIQRPELYECDKISIIDAACKAVAYGMETDGVLGRAFVIPRWSGQLGCKQANFQLGYRGVAELFYRAVPGGLIDAGYWCDNDDADYTTGTDFKVSVKKARGDRGQISHFYGFYRLPSGLITGEVMTVEEMLEHCDEYRADKKKSQDNRNYKGIWDIRFDEMGTKTMVVRICKRAPLSAESQRALVEEEYRNTGKYTIQQVGDNETDTGLTGEPADAPADKAPAKDGDEPRRMRMGKKKVAAAEDGAVDGASAPSAGEGSPAKEPATAATPKTSPPAEGAKASPPTEPAGGDLFQAKSPEDVKKWANEMAELSSTPEGRAELARRGTGGAAPQAAASPPPPPAEDPEPAPTIIDWLNMTQAEVWEEWCRMQKDERTATWSASPKEVQTIISNAAAVYQKKAPAPAAAAPAKPVEEPPQMTTARELVAKFKTPDEMVGWVMSNRFAVPADSRSVFAAGCGIDGTKLLNENPLDNIQAYATKLAYWLIVNGKPIVPANGASTKAHSGRPAARP